MKSNSARLLTMVLAAGLMTVEARGEIPKQSREELSESASHALVGKVVRTYERQERDQHDFEYTYGVAEISVDSVGKGSEIASSDRVFVRYWRKKWIGTGDPPPDHYGHWSIPNATDTVVAYVKGDRKTGFEVLSPNGFFEVTQAPRNSH